MSRRPTAHDAAEEDAGEAPRPTGAVEHKDQIIAHQRRMIRGLQKEFAGTLDALRAQLKDLAHESSRVQSDMLDRIRELKEEIAIRRQKQSPPRQTKASRAAVRSSLYAHGPKRPRKLAHAGA